MRKKYPFLVVLIFICAHQISEAQIVRLGFKAGPRMSWMKLDDAKQKSIVSVRPTMGFAVGGVASFKVKDRYFLHTELNYATKGKFTTGKIDPLLEDRVIYHYLDLPAMFSLQFKAHTKGDKQFKWYVGVGPNVSYWLGGKGVIKAGDLYENAIKKLDYTIAFGDRPNADRPDKMFVEGDNRLQFGLIAGGGILLEPGGNRKIMVDLRFEAGHTQLGEKGDFLIPTDYDDNLNARNMGVSLSIIYLFEFNLDPNVRNKGKSTIKRR